MPVPRQLGIVQAQYIVQCIKEDAMEDVTIMSADNGPYIVKGEVKVVDAGGNELETKETVALCRCGQSENKPFCDGAHVKAEFKSEVRAS